MKLDRRRRDGLRLRQSPDEATAWRRQSLLDAGIVPTVASALAAEPGMDLHALLQLIDQGCPPELAIRILAPTTYEGP